MIEWLKGTVDALTENGIILNTGLVGVALPVPGTRDITIHSTITLYTHLIWNQETGPHLFGFRTTLERTVFTLLIDCSGIGPKIAIAALEQLGAEAIIHALYEGAEAVLSSVSGIGTKKAEYMIVHLKQKAGKLITSGLISTNNRVSQLYELDSALQSLNYSRGEIHKALEHLKHFSSADHSSVTFDIMLRRALSYLSHKQ